MVERPNRKNIRLKDYDYSTNGAYFITICVKDKRTLLGKINVGCDAHIAPLSIELSKYGVILRKYIENINSSYDNVLIDKFVIMPNHIHMIIFLRNSRSDVGIAPYKASVPTVVRSLKTLVSKECGFSMWQTSFHDHIIRDEKDYQTHWRYIDENPAKWAEDEYYAG